MSVYDPNCIHCGDDDTCRCMCNECSEDCPFYDTLLSPEFEETLFEEQDYQESEFAAGVEHQKKRAIEAAKIIINRFYESRFDPSIDYLKLFIENL